MRRISYWFMAAVVCCLTFIAVSCKDDNNDDTNNSGEVLRDDADPMDTPAARTATRWFTALAGIDSLSNDWQQKEYEPTVGQASQNNELSRIIVVSDIDEARQNFSSLASVSVDALSTTQTVSQDGVGTLTWTPSADGDANLAVVDVRITQMPRLRSIVYCTSDQVGKNGLFGPNVSGTAYYRFGDVVRDPQGYYWVCVRPAFAPNKEKSYWANIFNASASGDNMPIPTENLISKWSNLPKYNNATIVLPTKLPAEREHVHNLNNLVAAIKSVDGPANIYTEVAARSQGKGLGGFDFNYNGTKFLTAVSRYWDEKTANGYTVWEILFGCTHDDMRKVMELNWFYKGYSWPSGYEAKLFCYHATGYNITMPGDESYDEVRVPVRDGIDIRRLARQQGASTTAFPPPAAGTKGNFLVRITTGDKLTTAKYSPYEPFIGGTTEIYRYNAKTEKNAREKLETEDDVVVPENKGKALAAPVVGCLVGNDGKFYRTVDAAKNNGTEAIAMVVYLGGTQRVEKDKEWNALAVALSDVKDIDGKVAELTLMGQASSSLRCCTSYANNDDGLALRLDGWANTKTMANEHKSGTHSHPAAAKVWADAPLRGSSEWFIPSTGQWILAMKGMGYGDYVDSGRELFRQKIFAFIQNGNWPWKEAGAEGAELQGKYLTVTNNTTQNNYERTVDNDIISAQAWAFDFTAKNFGINNKWSPLRCRPFIAFKYDNGGTENPVEKWKPLTEPVTRCFIGEDGNFYATSIDVWTATDHSPSAFVMYVGKKGDVKVDGKEYRGLALGLDKYDQNGQMTNDYEGTTWNGLNDVIARHFSYLTPEVRARRGFSAWFVPTVSQLRMMFKDGFGVTFDDNTLSAVGDEKGEMQTKIYDTYFDSHIRTSGINGCYWTADSFDDTKAYYLRFYQREIIKFEKLDKDANIAEGKYKMRVRPVIAF